MFGGTVALMSYWHHGVKRASQSPSRLHGTYDPTDSLTAFINRNAAGLKDSNQKQKTRQHQSSVLSSVNVSAGGPESRIGKSVDRRHK
jgi:hypothetical protein